MAKNRQKSAKIMKKQKIDFPYNNFPKKEIFLRKCTPKNIFRLRRKKKSIFFFAPAALYRCDPVGGAIEFLDSRILGF